MALVNTSNKEMPIYVVRAIYLGNEPMGELLDGENGSDAVQVPLKRTILRTDGVGDECDVIITSDALCIKIIESKILENKNKLIQLPIDTLAYCGALRQLPPENVKEREFETLDKTPSDSKNTDPPLFVTIFRSLDNENTLLCHSFVIRKDIEAMELVKNVMQVYYNIIDQIENAETLLNHSSVNITQQASNNDLLNNSITNYLQSKSQQNFTDNYDIINSKPLTLTQAELDRLLETYNRTGTNTAGAISSSEFKYEGFQAINSGGTEQHATQSILNNNGSSQFVVNGTQSAHDILAANGLDPSQYEILNEALNDKVTALADYLNIPLNQDDDPLIIKKKNDEKICYKQNVFIRWLQPPTPPPPAPIIIREVQAPPDPLPPVVIYKQAPRPKTPPPLVIREKPPTPIEPTEPIIIERRVSPPHDQQKRRVIVEELPAPPPKPRDIIIEKWLPREKVTKRTVVVEKLKDQAYQQHNRYQPPVYEYVETSKPVYRSPNRYNTYDYHDSRYGYHHQHQHSQPIYDVIDRTSRPAKRIIKQILRPSARANEYYGSHVYDDNYRRHHEIMPPTNYVYNSHNQMPRYHKPRLAGYRVIRQIIPGPNATPADIENAIVRSQQIGENSYSKYFDNTNLYSKHHSKPINYYEPGYNYSRQKPIIVEQTYVPHKSSSTIRHREANSLSKSTTID